MKSTILFLMLILATPAAMPVAAQIPLISGEQAAPQSDDDSAAVVEPRHISLNMTPAEVLAAMQGAPDEKLSPSIWVYYGFHSQRDPALRRFDTLVVYFSPEHVYKYRLVERKALRELLADVRRTPTPSQPEMISEWPAPPRLDEVAPAVAPRRIGLRMTPEDVVRAMRGNPDAYLAPDIWVYWQFQVSSNPAPRDPDTLLVFFSQGRVVHYKLVRREAVMPWLEGRAA